MVLGAVVVNGWNGSQLGQEMFEAYGGQLSANIAGRIYQVVRAYNRDAASIH